MTTSKQKPDAMHDDFLGCLLSGDRMGGSRFIHTLMQSDFSLKDVYEKVIKKSLYTIGEMWEQNKITVAEEHLATSVSEAIMNEFFTEIVSPLRKQRKVMVGCVEQELHQVGAKMVADIFEMKGWDSYFLGANVPLTDHIRFSQELMPDLFAISVSIYFHIPQLENMLVSIRASLPNTPVLVGGQAFRHGGQEMVDKQPNVFYVADLYALESFIDKFEQQWESNTC